MTQGFPLPRRQAAPTPETGWPAPGSYEPPVVVMPDAPVAQGTSTETHESPIFSQLVREQAELLGSGGITVDNFSDFLGVANQVSLTDYGDTDVYTGPSGEPLDEGTARPLYEARTPEHWILGSQDAKAGVVGQTDPETSAPQHPRPETLTAAQLPVVAKVFQRYGNMSEADIPEDQRDKLAVARQRVANTLGITDPSGLSLLDLEQRILARQALSEAVADGRFDPQFLPRFTRRQRAGRDPDPTAAADPAQAHAAPLSAGGRSAAAAPARTADPGRPGRRRRPAEPTSPAGADDRVIRSHRRDPKTDTQRIERRRQIVRVAVSVAATATLSSVLKVADVVPGGSVGVGAVTGMVGMVLATRFNKELWGNLEGGRQKWKALGKAALLGAGLGAAVAAGTMLITDVASAGIDAIRGAFTDHSTATLHHLPNVAPDPGGGTTTPPPVTPPPPTPHAFSAPMQTDSLGAFTGVDGPDSNPWAEGTGYDAVGDRLAAEYQLATGHALDWSTINPQDYHNFVGQVLEQNHIGDGYDSVWAGSEHMSNGATLTIDPQKALEFLISQRPDAALSLIAA